MPDSSLQPELQAGALYLVGTPIGNLEDITFRAVRVLNTVDLIAAEDTRHTGKLLQHFQIQTSQVSYHDHNTQQRIPELIAHLTEGKTLALVTDAGMPGISDPGYELVCACVQQGLTVIPIPGPSAVVTALAVAALPTDRFVFEGFLPAKGKARRDRITALQTESRTILLYESPHRLLQTLTDLATTLSPERPVTLARELTKRYEEFWRGTLADAIAHCTTVPPRGEFTIAIAGAPVSNPVLSEAAILDELKALMQQGLSRSEASRQLAQGTRFSRREVYQLSLRLSDG
ncbi:16S rRNA (cytidine(1402)-2'-O)-methyltransferase [Romeria aff. gracilis LEGE 07310]|uniref:Ribosomal RNA small subunit methyltransferase I n=1 Tax=Vasconcelosia minhoensis LEGE 07310 TaxID=915328 RepID=A0A8J7AB11_9CYAN|nr:16S rRNA (cytidine(1402)-2'-O)-methyltransferase [Romeria aff. gracilis LEGE 07310]